MFNADKKSTEEIKRTVKPNKITPAKLLIAFAAVLVPTAALKTYHMFKFTDPETGFFVDRTSITVYLFYILLVAGVLLITLLSYLAARGGNLPAGAVFRKRDITTGILALGTAAALAFRVYEVYLELSEIAVRNNVNLFEATKLEHHNVFFFGQLVFGALGALWLLLYSVSRFAGKDLCTKLRIFSLAPAVWGACRVIEYFTVTISYLNVAELFCDIFTAVLSMIFLFCLARTAADVDGDNAVWSVFASGLSLAVVALPTQIIRIYLFLSGNGRLIVTDRSFSILYLLLALFALSAVLFAASKKHKAPAASVADWDIADTQELTETAPEAEAAPETAPETEEEAPADTGISPEIQAEIDAAVEESVLSQTDVSAEADETAE